MFKEVYSYLECVPLDFFSFPKAAFWPTYSYADENEQFTMNYLHWSVGQRTAILMSVNSLLWNIYIVWFKHNNENITWLLISITIIFTLQERAWCSVLYICRQKDQGDQNQQQEKRITGWWTADIWTVTRQKKMDCCRQFLYQMYKQGASNGVHDLK